MQKNEKILPACMRAGLYPYDKYTDGYKKNWHKMIEKASGEELEHLIEELEIQKNLNMGDIYGKNGVSL